MITGFNTDIKHSERVFHVQTEDRGLENPVVESLVYVGGEILLSKKSPYRDLVKGNRVDEKAVREMMDLQHRRVIEAIRRGRLDAGRVGEVPPEWADEDTFPSGQKVSAAARAAAAAILSVPSEPLPGARSGERPALPPAPKPSVSGLKPQVAPSPPAESVVARAPRTPIPGASVAAPRPTVEPPPPAPPPAVRSSPPAPVVTTSQPMPVVPPPATPARPPASVEAASASPSAPPQVPGPYSPSGVRKISTGPLSPVRPTSGAMNVRSLDQVIVDYLASEAASEHLELSLMVGNELVSGESVQMVIRATTSLTDKPIAGANVSIRVVSTNRPPRVLFRGLTGADGYAKTTCSLPDIGTGNAALIVAASSPLGSNEVKQPIQRKR